MAELPTYLTKYQNLDLQFSSGEAVSCIGNKHLIVWHLINNQTEIEFIQYKYDFCSKIIDMIFVLVVSLSILYFSLPRLFHCQNLHTNLM